MVIGAGLVAKSLEGYQNSETILIFASGVSNSSENRKQEFEREKVLLENCLNQNPHKKFIYISTYSIYNPKLEDTPYVQHKLSMEKLVSEKAKRYQIFRVSNLVGKNKKNKNTVINFFINAITNGTSFTVWKNAWRNILDIKDFSTIVKYFIDNEIAENKIINIANPYDISVLKIIEAIENYLGKKGNYDIVNKGERVIVDTKIMKTHLPQIGISFLSSSVYFEKTLNNYSIYLEERLCKEN